MSQGDLEPAGLHVRKPSQYSHLNPAKRCDLNTRPKSVSLDRAVRIRYRYDVTSKGAILSLLTITLSLQNV